MGPGDRRNAQTVRAKAYTDRWRIVDAEDKGPGDVDQAVGRQWATANAGVAVVDEETREVRFNENRRSYARRHEHISTLWEESTVRDLRSKVR